MTTFPFDRNPNMLVPWYLMASYGYYVRDESLMSDADFDRVCHMLNDQWDEIEHVHKAIVDRAALSAGTCMLGREEYPTMVKGAACRLLKIKMEEADLPIGLLGTIGTLDRELSLLCAALASR